MKLPLDCVLNRDCVAGLAELPTGLVQLAFADPPFNIGYEYDVYEDRKQADDYLGWCRQWIAELHRVLTDDGAFWLAIGDEFAAELKLIAQREVGFTIRSWVVWYYTFGVNCKKKFSRSHAHLFHFVKNATQFTFHDQEIRVPSARQLVYGDGRANPAGRLPDDTWIVPPRAVEMMDGERTFTLRPQDLPQGFRPDEDTWYFPRVAGTFKQRAGWHGCQMPEQLLGRIVRSCSNAGDTILDPFGGSGTTLAVAKKLHRHFLGFELSAEYAVNLEKRLASIKAGDALEGAPEPLVSSPSTAGGISLAERQQNRTRYRRKRQSVSTGQKPLL
ncbi:MAG: site-specific DNA-methyltransferase [Pirellulales bacterium]|nr:site-specific DNA-methyltransferase [Pirellulales bacterium]